MDTKPHRGGDALYTAVVFKLDTETGLFQTGLVSDIDVSEVCILDYDNSTVVPLTGLCSSMGTGREDLIDFHKLCAMSQITRN